MNSPSVHTKLVFLLGQPLGHSISPAMHNRVFEQLGLDYLYLPVEVSATNLGTVFEGLVKMNTGGFNVTVPHKLSIISYLDELDPLARNIGAVNTICLENGKSVGYNTDGIGFVRSLTESSDLVVARSRFFILGAGGAARAIAMTLAAEGARKVFICNRTVAKAQRLVGDIDVTFPGAAAVIEPDDRNLGQTLGDCQALINTTTIGMAPQSENLPLAEELLFSELVVADIVYNPLTTRLLAAARAKGCRTVHGLGMLIYQGVAAFELWTGRQPLVEEMNKVAYAILGQP